MSHQSDYFLLDNLNVLISGKEIMLIYVSRFRTMKLIYGRKSVSLDPTF